VGHDHQPGDEAPADFRPNGADRFEKSVDAEADFQPLGCRLEVDIGGAAEVNLLVR
jgi:hypothetical protein